MTIEAFPTEAMTIPPPEPPRPPAAGPADWVRRNLFRSVGDGIVTVVAGIVVLYVAYRGLRYLFVTARWEIVRVNLRLFLTGRYPVDELWRVSVAVALIALFIGVVAGFAPKRRRLMGMADAAPAERRWWRRALATAARLWPLIVGVALDHVDGHVGGPVADAAGDRRCRDRRPAGRSRSSPPAAARSSCSSRSSGSARSSCSCASRSTSRTGAA